MLHIDPLRRGGGDRANNECFDKIEQIRSMKIVKVLNMKNCNQISYEYLSGDTVADLKQFIYHKKGIPPGLQELYYSSIEKQHENLLKDEDTLDGYFQQPDELYLFPRGSIEYDIPNCEPREVRELRKEPEEIRTLSELKRYWCYAYIYCKQQVDLCRRMLRGQRAVVISLKSVMVCLTKLHRDLESKNIRLSTYLEMYIESLDWDNECYQRQFPEKSLRTHAINSKIEELQKDQTQELQVKIKEVQTHFVSMQKDMESLNQEHKVNKLGER